MKKQKTTTYGLMTIFAILPLCLVLSQHKSHAQQNFRDSVITKVSGYYFDCNFQKGENYINPILDKSKNNLDSDLYAWRSLVSVKNGNYESATKDINRAFEIDADNMLAHMARLQILSANGSREALLTNRKYLRQLLQTAPENPLVLLTEAIFKEAMDDIFGALESVNKASAIQPDAAYINAYKGALLVQTTDMAGAKKALTKAMKQNPEYMEIYVGLGKACLSLGHYDEALKHLDYSITRDSANTELLYLRGIVKNNLSDSTGAIADFDKVIENDNAFIDAYFHRSHAKFTARRFEDSILDMDEFISIKNNNAEAYSKRALSKIMLKDKEGACLDFNRAIELGDVSAEKIMQSFCQ